MRPDEVGMIRAWADAEGRGPGLHTGACFFATDPAGFFIGELGGRPISSISCMAYDGSFDFVGLYIVRPEFRGRGYGLQTRGAGLARLGGRNVGLDGVVAQQANYERSGLGAARLVGRFGTRDVFCTARMYTRGRPRLGAGRVFGITSMELG
jgi:hypothetical protein